MLTQSTTREEPAERSRCATGGSTTSKPFGTNLRAGVQGTGFATSYCYTCPRPTEFGHVGEAWDIVGWRVDVEFRPVSRVIHPKEHLSVLGPLLANERFSPLRVTGDGLQHVYLTSISEQFAQVLLGLAGVDSQQIAAVSQMNDLAPPLAERELIGQQECEHIEQRRVLQADIPQTTRKALVSARIGLSHRVG